MHSFQSSTPWTRVSFAEDKTVRQISTDQADDVTPFIYYPLLTTKEVGYDALHRLRRSELKEVDRLDICVDLVTPVTRKGSELLAFKYEMLEIRLESTWTEVFLIKRLKGCPHIVSLYKFIVDDIEPRLLGYTTYFVPGGNLQKSTRPFRKDWLLQLLSFVDSLILNYGIVHQENAPRNLNVDQATDHLTVIDFGMAAQIGSKQEKGPRNDIDGVLFTLHEILTRDLEFRDRLMPEDFNIEDIVSMKSWPLRVHLEPGLDVETLRYIAADWAKGRREKTTVPANGGLQKAIDIPPVPSMQVDKVIVKGKHWEGAETYPLRNMVSTGERIVRWERPPQKKTQSTEGNTV